MRDPNELKREDVFRAAATFRWTKKMPKWTVVVLGRELPARPLVLRAAGVAPNDPTNSYQAVAILEGLGFETKYSEMPHTANMPATEEVQDFDDALGGIAEAISAIGNQVPKSARDAVPSDLSRNVDHYLYGTEKEE